MAALHLAALGLALATLGCSTSPPAGPRPPNVILIMTDDQGWGDLGCHGNPLLDTPNVDALAAASVRVEPFYVHPVCSPTRAALMTGRYPYRTRAIDTYIGRAMMEPSERTIAELLGDAGYATGIFGKWHLGDCYPMRPIDQGFEEALVHRGGGIGQASDPPGGEGRYTDAVLFRNGERVETSGYCTDAYFDAAMGFVRRAKDAGRPFFAYIATNAPHAPFGDVPEELRAKYAARDLRNASFPADVGHPLPANADLDRRARIYAMIENIDQNVGRLLSLLDELDLTDDTIVVYLHDNGPNGRRYNGGFRGSKTDVHEGGIRSPLFVRWPGHLEPADRREHWAAHIDILPTVLDLCGVPAPVELELDGTSIVPLLEGRAEAWSDRTLFVQTHRGNTPVAEHHFAVRTTRWKLVRASGFGREQPPDDTPFELYDLSVDPYEERDVAARHPEVVANLRARYRAWFDDVSSTRPDNYAPPRIVVGSPRAPTTVLTRQDWRVTERDRGLVDVATPGEYAVSCTMRPIDRAATATLELGGRTIDVDLDPGAQSCTFPAIDLRTGPTTLRIVRRAGPDLIGVWQVTVTPVPG
jgi:arylsulfatase A-like enzyme